MKILVTGGAGFIFTNFIRNVLYNNLYEIVSIDKILLEKSLHNIYSNKNHKSYIGDIADEHFVNLIMKIEKPDLIINGAAESFVDSSITNINPFIHSNINGMQTIINAALKHNIKLIQCSTDEVYGHLNNEDDPSWKEDAPINPRNPYAATKASSELLVKAAGNTHGLKYLITRSCNNFGPRQPLRNLIPVVINAILNKKDIPVYGQGKQIREWIYVADFNFALLKLIELFKNDIITNDVYNISSGFEISNLEMVNHICNIIGYGHDKITFVKDRPGHDFRYSCDSSKLRNLGWKPESKFLDGLQETVNWYVKNQWYLK